MFSVSGHLVEMGDALPALPQTRGLQALEDSGEGAAGPVSPRAGVTACPRHAATYTHTHTHTVNTIWKRRSLFQKEFFRVSHHHIKAELHLFS